MLAVSLPTLAELVHGSAPSKTSIARLAKFYKANVPENGVGVLCNETPFFQERLALISAS